VKRLTVVHVTAPGAFGGLERVVSGLARETAARGHRAIIVAVLTPTAPEPGWLSVAAASGVEVEILRLPTRAYLRERREVRRILARSSADVLHTHGYRSDVLHLGIARRMRLPAVTTAHGFASNKARGSLYERLQLHSWRRFDAVVAVSEPLVTRIAGAGVSRDRIVLIRNGGSSGGELLSRAAARSRLALPLAGQCVGWVGRMSEEKDPLLAIESVARLRSATLCFIGAGSLREACVARATELGVADRVVFAGAVPDAAPLFSAFDALVLSSRTEGTPMVVLEAAAAGVPVVSTAVGGVPDLLRDDAGWLVAPGDAAALAEGMRAALADSGESRRRASRLQERLAAKSGEADWVDQYLELYAKQISANPS
jgi:glycosyltransferase involved in cell wall biosynthesis